MSSKSEVEVEVGGKSLRLTNLDKVMYPSTGFTKGGVIDYYQSVAPVMLNHITGFPLTLKRFPNGVDGKFFYEKQCPKHRPDWFEVIPIPASHRVVEYSAVSSVAGLVWLANLASLEIHPLLARGEDLEHPARMTFDLDPGAPATIVECAKVALELRRTLDSLGLDCSPKTSGSKGMQVDVGLDGTATFDETKEFANALARLLEKAQPKAVVARMEKNLRKGKIFIDWSQNHITKTTVSVYSLRAVPEQRVSTPITWDEVQECADGKPLSFLASDVLDRIEEFGDLHDGVLTRLGRLPSLEDLIGAV